MNNDTFDDKLEQLAKAAKHDDTFKKLDDMEEELQLDQSENSAGNESVEKQKDSFLSNQLLEENPILANRLLNDDK